MAQTSPVSAQSVSPTDYKGFAQRIDQIRKKTLANLSEKDVKHLQAVERVGRLLKLIGYLTAWIMPNPISVIGLSAGNTTRWAMAHHILHKGYDRVPNAPARFTSRVFAHKWRRFVDWFDWLHPAGWAYEHNILHHCHTGEDTDPDLLARETAYLRELRLPRVIKYIMLFLIGVTWKFTFYAPSTTSVINPKTGKRIGNKDIAYISILDIFKWGDARVRRLWTHAYLPYGLWHFAIIPALFLPLGTTAALFVLCNKLLAEMLANFHTFVIVGPNHTGDDLYRFAEHPKSKDQYYVTQILASVNYQTGTPWRDFSQMWLNYQIEHHLFPDVPMSKYKDMQPEIKKLCAQYGIPYLQESVWVRFRKMLDVCIGKTHQREITITDYQTSQAKSESGLHV